jgi:hypothetical protein
MFDEMSNLRIAGVVIAVGLVIFAFRYFRGPRWNRLSFVLAWLLACALLTVSVDPDTVNALRDAFNLGQFAYGRLFAILIISNVVALLLVIYINAKADAVKNLVDQIMRVDALDAVVGPSGAVPADGAMILIPALNEADNLRLLLPQIPKEVCGLKVGVLAIDDGSTDDTREVALNHGAWVARFPIRRGQGAALRVGYSFLMRERIRVGITMDADNQHRPDEIEKLVRPILDGRFDLVIGSRMLGSAERDSHTRYLGVILFSRLVSWLTGVKITDCSSGFRAFDVDKMAQLDLRQDQFQTSEVLITAAKKGMRIGEVPIHIARRRYGESRKGPNFSYGLFFLKTVARTWWR